MKILGTVLLALLLATVASAQASHDKLHGPKITRRSADGDFHDFLKGIELKPRSGNLPVPKLFRRDLGCPLRAPNTCDVKWCSQVCCGDGNGNYCRYGHYCTSTGCCKVGKTCSGSGGGWSGGDGLTGGELNTTGSNNDSNGPSDGSQPSGANQGQRVCIGVAGVFLAAFVAAVL